MDNPQFGHNGGPPLEDIERCYPDVPESRSISEWCNAQGIHRTGWYNLPDKPQTIRVGHRLIITRLAHFRWLQRCLAEAEIGAGRVERAARSLDAAKAKAPESEQGIIEAIRAKLNARGE